MLEFRKTVIVAVLLFTAIISGAQSEKLELTQKYLIAGQLDSAKVAIDAASLHPSTMTDAQTWYMKGFVYKEMYKKKEKDNVKSSLRLQAVEYFKKSIKLDTTKENKENNDKNLSYLANSFNKNAKFAIDSGKYELAIECYDRYRDIMIDISNPLELKKKDVEFYLALGSLYYSIYESNKKTKVGFLEFTKKAYEKVLSSDRDNLNANYGLGILYYNEGAELANQTDYDVDLVMFGDVQDKVVKLFQKSLPYMQKAYALNPKRKDILIGLYGIYYGLYEFDKANEFKRMADAIDK